jgi:hypothetical protein
MLHDSARNVAATMAYQDDQNPDKYARAYDASVRSGKAVKQARKALIGE